MKTETRTNTFKNEGTNNGFLTEAMELDYFTKYKTAVESNDLTTVNKIRDIIVKANQRLVMSQASNYVGYNLEFADLVQEGNMGLLKAIDKFDVSMGNRFSTYATYWIQQSIELAVYYQNDTVRVPVYYKKLLTKVRKTKSRMTSLLGKEPSNIELANELEMELDKLEECLAYTNEVTSLDKNIGDDDSTMLDMVSSKTLTPYERCCEQSKSDTLTDLINGLPEKEQFVIKNRYGVLGGAVLTLEQIGKALNVSHERVRQIERKALAILRERAEPARAFLVG